MTSHNEAEYTGKLMYQLGETLLEKEDIIIHSKPKLSFDKQGYLYPEVKEELLKFHPEVVLYCPQIPPNTGTIARMCAAFSCTLHLIEPMGFHITEKALRRAGLDYWEHVSVYLHKSWDLFLSTRKKRRIIFVETGGNQSPYDFQFQPGDLLVFGAETFGIPKELMDEEISKGNAEIVTIPMFNTGVRSLNLSNTVSIVMYVAIAKIQS